PRVDLTHARTQSADPNAAAEDLCNQLGAVVPKLVTVFGSSDRDHHALNRALRDRLPRTTRILGATTNGELDREGMHTGSVVVAVGGGAANSQLDATGPMPRVHVDGEVATDAVAVALFKTDAPWAAMRSHWYEPTGQTIRITKIDDTARRALEIDGQPAAKR